MREYTFINQNPAFPVMLVDNWYDEQSEKDVWKELEFYTNEDKMIRQDNDGSYARDKEGKSTGQSFRIFLDETYQPQARNVSTILTKQQELINTDWFCEKAEQLTPMSRSFFTSNCDRTLVSYYNDSDYYKAHHDTFLFSIIIWFHKTPKRYTGGDLFLPEIQTKIESKHNRLIFFPSFINHEVTPIKMNDPKPNQLGLGRYSITHFYTYVPNLPRSDNA